MFVHRQGILLSIAVSITQFSPFAPIEPENAQSIRLWCILLGEAILQTMPTVTDFTKAYGVQPNTIRHWASNFDSFLSPGANPAKGQRRRFNHDDAEVIALIAELRQEYKSYETITAALAAGDRGQWPPEGNQAAHDDAGETRTGEGVSLALVTQLTARAASLEGELKATKAELDRRLAEIDDLKTAVRDAEKRATRAETIIGVQLETPTAPNVQSGAGSGGEDATAETPPAKLTRRQRLANWISGEG
jgi:DNA-binding transcriptional MerR regulator